MRARHVVPVLGFCVAALLLTSGVIVAVAPATPAPPAKPAAPSAPAAQVVPAPAPPAPVPAAVQKQVLVVGDSLAVGTEPYLGSLLADRQVTFDAVTGRTTPEGLRALRERLQDLRPQTVIISLGTNDGSDPARFAFRIHEVLSTVPPDACVVWSTVVRPPRKGSYLGLNRVLRAYAQRVPRLTLVNWDHAVLRGSVTLPDTVHPDPAGFLYRSRLFAHAVHRGCAAQASPSGGAPA